MFFFLLFEIPLNELIMDIKSDEHVELDRGQAGGYTLVLLHLLIMICYSAANWSFLVPLLSRDDLFMSYYLMYNSIIYAIYCMDLSTLISMILLVITVSPILYLRCLLYILFDAV